MPPDGISNSGGRKSSKPLMEKRRRARINQSLMQLKCLVLEATSTNSSRHSKLEKADILEMTVKYLKGTYRSQTTGASNEVGSSLASEYRCGFNECMNEVSRFLNQTTNPGIELRTRLINHLANACNSSVEPPTHSRQPTKTQSSQPVQKQLRDVHRPVIQSAPSSSLGAHPATIISIISQPVDAQRIASVTSVARLVSGLPIGLSNSITAGEVALVVPQQYVPVPVPSAGSLQTHIIPIYEGSSVVGSQNLIHLCSLSPQCTDSLIRTSLNNPIEKSSSILPLTNTTVPSALKPVVIVGAHSSSGIVSVSRPNISHAPQASTSSRAAEQVPLIMKTEDNELVEEPSHPNDVDPMWRPW